MEDLNRIILLGRLTDNPTITDKYGKFSIAVNGYKKDDVSFFNCVSWMGPLNNILSQYCHKGDRIAVSGKLKQNSWTNKEGKKVSDVQIIVSEIQLLSPKKDSVSTTTVKSNASPIFENELIYDNEIPF